MNILYIYVCMLVCTYMFVRNGLKANVCPVENKFKKIKTPLNR